MPVQFTFTDAAHKYAFDNMPVDTATSFANSNVLGQVTGVIPSWNGDIPPIAVTSTLTGEFANGFTQIIALRAFSSTTGTIDSMNYYKSDTKELLVQIGTSIPFNVTSGIDSRIEVMMSGNDAITGNSFNNKLRGFGGNDRIDGGGGVDTAYYGNARSTYTVTGNGSTFNVSGSEGFDTLVNIERIRFLDKAIAYDIDGNAGQAYRLYQAALNRKPDLGGLGAQMNGLDSGMSLQQISQNFINSAEFGLKYGTGLSNEAFVTQLYANVLHRTPDAGGFAVQVNALYNGMSRAQLLVNFSESNENFNATIVGIQNGIEYTPFA